MPIPPIQKQLALKQIEKFCANKFPPHVQDQLKLKYTLQDPSIILYESRPQWNDPSRWIDLEVAKMTFVKKSMKWKLYWMRASGKWELYNNIEPIKDLQVCIDEIDTDPLCTFWG